jgi:hypothetical protein
VDYIEETIAAIPVPEPPTARSKKRLLPLRLRAKILLSSSTS